MINKIKIISLYFDTMKIIYYLLKNFEKYTFEISINRFKIKVIKLAINIGVDEIL